MGNWSSYEVMFLFALNSAAYAVASTFFYRAFLRLPNNIRDGSFDEVLLRPVNNFLYYIIKCFSTNWSGTFVISLIMMLICFIKLGISLDIAKVLFLIIVILSGGLIQSAMMIITSVPSFWIIDSSAMSNIFFGNLKNFIDYPLSIYNKSIQILLTIILPYAFVNFYPAQYFLGKNDFTFFYPLFQYLSPLVGTILFIVAYRFWKLGVTHYCSTGS